MTILLAALGVLAGILLRVQSFLYLGFTFLIVVIGRMIVYAAFEEKHIWVFWVSCIVLGTMIFCSLPCSRSGATTCWRPWNNSSSGNGDYRPVGRLNFRPDGLRFWVPCPPAGGIYLLRSCWRA